LIAGLDAVRERFGEGSVQFGRELRKTVQDTGTPSGTEGSDD
jgi:hypothetical protein